MASNGTYRHGALRISSGTPGYPRRRRIASVRPLIRAIAEALEPRRLLSLAAPGPLDLMADSDTGWSNSDNITSDYTPTFVVYVPSWTSYRVYRDSTLISSLSEYNPNPNAYFALFTAPPQADGTYSFSVTSVDTTGYESPKSAPLVVTIDTTAPQPPKVSLNALSDSGVSNSDRLTNVVAPTFDVQTNDAGFPHIQLDGSGDIGVRTRVDGPGTYAIQTAPSSFQQASKITSPDYNSDVITADFNGDGILDFVTTNYTANGVSVYLGNGDGTFKPRVKTTLSYDVVHMTCGDFNGDSKADLALVTNYGATVVVLLGNGNGTFKTGWTFSAGMRVPHKITSGDLDGDGKLDLVVGETDTSKLWFFRGDGTGKFSTWKTFDLGGWFKSVVLADFNGDGRLDVAWGDRGEAKIGLILQDAKGNFNITRTYPTTAGPFEMTAGDFNGDGAVDIITADLDGDAMSVFLNNGDGTFRDHTSFYTGVEPIDLVPADFNHDGRLDLAVLHYEGHKLSILLGNGNGTFTLSQERNTELYPWALAAGDFNRDGELDLIAAGCYYLDLVMAQPPRLSDGTHSVSGWMEDLAGNRSASSAAMTFTIDTQAPATPGAPDLADASDTGISNTDNITNDNTPTLTATGGNYFRFYENDKQLSGDYQASSFTTGLLLDGKHAMTVAAADAAGNVSAVSSVFDVTIDTIAPPVPLVPDLDAGSDTGVSDSDNVTKDNAPTFDLQLAGTDYFRVYCDGKRISDLYQPASSQYTAMLQVDGQHQYALAAVDAAGNQSQMSQSITVIIDTVAPPAPPRPDLMWAYDTGISDSDNVTRSTFVHFQLSAGEAGTLYLGADGSSLDRSLRVNSAGTYSRDVGMRHVSFTAKGVLQTHSALELAVADVNKDGCPDVLMVAHNEGLYLALGNGDGTFQAFQQLPTAAPPFRIIVADVNSDGNPDIAVANGTLSVLLGNGDGTFQGAKVVPDVSICYTFVVADLDSDGHPDLLPVDAVNDRFTVRLGNGDGTFRAGPQVPTGHMIFPSSLQTGDINGDGILDVVYRGSFDNTLHAHLGNGDGTFQPDIQTALTPLQPYPRELGVGDFNEDGKLDIVLTGTGQPAVLLRGNGDGTFTAGSSVKVGLSPEGMAVGDFDEDGHLDFAVAAADNDEVLIVAGFGNGTFDGRGLYAVGDNPLDVYAADLNGDGKLDLLTRDVISDTTTVLLNTSVPMPDGPHQITAWFEDLAGNISPVSETLTFTLDTTAPTAEVAEIAPDPASRRVEAITITFSEPVAGLDLGDLKLCREGGANLLTAAQTLSSTDSRTWVLGNLAGLTNSVGSYVLTLAGTSSGITDVAGNPLGVGAIRSFRISNLPPVLQPIDNLTVDEGNTVSFTALAEDHDVPAQTLTFSLLDGPEGAGIDPVTGVFTWTPSYEQAGRYTFGVRVTDNGEPSFSATQAVTIVVKDVPPLQVVAMNPTPSGFDIRFNGAIDLSKLNLYDGIASKGRAADLTVVGQKSGPVAGSLIWDGTDNTLHFVRTGSVLVADAYSVTLFSRGDGFAGLDGDGDGRIGGDYSRTVTVATGQGPIVILPDIARGPGQSFALPLRISSAAGVLSFTGELQFDPRLMSVSELALGAGLPANWTVMTNEAGPGRIAFAAYGVTALSGSAKDLLMVKAAVPADAPYGAVGTMKLADAQVNELPAQGDTAVVAVAYLGDASGNGLYGGLDAAAIGAVAVGAVSGFDAYPLIDPKIIGDVNGNGSIGGLDASLIAQKSVGVDVPQIPDLPAAAPVAFNRVQAGSNSAASALLSRILRTPYAGLFGNGFIAGEW